jgi:hypothetical protein
MKQTCSAFARRPNACPYNNAREGNSVCVYRHRRRRAIEAVGVMTRVALNSWSQVSMMASVRGSNPDPSGPRLSAATRNIEQRNTDHSDE